MRWLGFAVCAVIALTLQTTLAWRLAIQGARPEWLLVLAVFFALHAQSADALIGAWLLGAAMDLMSVGRFGLLSGCYGLATLAIYAIREYVFRDNPLSHFVLTFLAAAAVGLAEAGYHVAIINGHAATGALAATGHILLAAAYTAVWAPPVHYVLLKFPRALGIRAPRRGFRPGRA